MASYYRVQFKNVEGVDCIAWLLPENLDSGFTEMEGSDFPSILETVNTDEDKTISIRSKRLRIGFNSAVYPTSSTRIEARTFSGDDVFDGYVICNNLSIPFVGELSYEDNQEAFQPKPNPVQLTAGDGLGALKQIELTESDGDIPRGHYRIIDYVWLCLRNINPNIYTIGNGATPLKIHVVFNLYEEDTDPTTTSAFFDTFLDAETFKKDAESMDDCLTVLTKILDAFGCFITYDHDGWYIIRWDEYDRLGGGVTTLRSANFDSDGLFVDFTDLDLSKVISADYDPLYEGYRLSNDNALIRFQKKVKSVKHIYRYQQINAPCNKNFTEGAVIDDVLPLKAYEVSCWDVRRGWGANLTTPNSDAQIWVRFDANDNESERYLILTQQLSSGGEFNYARSQGIPIDEKDKFTFSFDYSADSDNSTNGPASIGIANVVLYGDDSSVWVLGDNINVLGDPSVPEWKLSNADLSVNNDYYKWFFDSSSGSEDYRDFRNYSIEAPPAPVSGSVYIHFFAANQSPASIDNFVMRYNNVQFNYIPFINGTYGTINGQSITVSEDNGSKRILEKEMFIGDSPKPNFKGALKKFNGTGYVLTGAWSDYITPSVLPDSQLSKHIVFQWWNQYRKNRTVIESDFQGINSDQEFGIPGLIHRWQIKHEEVGDKYFMLTSLRDLNFRNCQWSGVLVETSSEEGDRIYTDDFVFKFIR